MKCPHCGQPFFRKSASGARLKARVSILVVKGRSLETNCPHCRRGVVLPVQLADPPQLRKAEVLVARGRERI